MKKVVSTAKTTAATVIKVPRQIGHTILSLPQAIEKITKKDNGDDENNQSNKPMYADKLEFINKEIFEDQGRRQMVRDSISDCMREIIDHLILFLDGHNKNGNIPTYEQWIAALHPDNAEYLDGSIDHRFYVEDSDHRMLWNKFMSGLDHKDRIVEARSVLPNYKRK